MMRLTCLGRYGPYPAPDGGTSSYLLQSDEVSLLLDCGAGAVSRLQRYAKMDALSGVLFSHLHDDHISDAPVLGYAAAVLRTEPLPVYHPAFPEEKARTLDTIPQFETHTIEEGSCLLFADISVHFCQTAHPLVCYAMRISDGMNTLIYTGDSAWDDSLVQFCHGADVLLCDAAFTESNQPVRAPHMNGKEAAYLAQKAEVGKLVLTHLHPNTEEENLLSQARTIFENTEIMQENGTILIV